MKRVRSPTAISDADRMVQDVDDSQDGQQEVEPDQMGPKRPRTDQQALLDDLGGDDGDTMDASDIHERDVQTLDQRIDRLQSGTANAEDLGEIVRLAAGHIESGTQAARRGGGFYPRLRKAYDSLWESLTWGSGAAAVVAEAARAGRISGWPPTFADVQAVYAEMEPATAGRHMARIEDESAVSGPAIAGQSLGMALGQAVRRQAALASMDPSALTLATDARDLAQSLACTPTGAYYVLRFYVDSEAWVMLVNLTPQPGHSPLVSAISMPDDAHRFRYRMHVAAPPFSVSPALQPLIDRVAPFLASLARPAPWEEPVPLDALSSLLLEPLPTGAAQIDALMVPVPSSLALPSGVQYALTLIGRENANAVDDASLYGAQVDECHLALAVRLFAGQIDARLAGASARRQAQTSLVQAAAAAYNGPLDLGLVSRDVLDRAAAYAWQRTCRAPSLPNGRLRDSARLVEAAAVWGVGVDPLVVARRPELLCHQLAPLAVARLRAPATLS
ncbi:hypothetical protein psal_cds_1397 [Pandoravirus salinus]|uniref:Uncharacterized protein n=1 Tax=Pandoravirus salinus TaxID=1349410 RepID=S4W1X8_9VIRU|nr:hypothetical protein psal_cds_1397 [Pandoravirus salinus]AGO85821.1 hypothetical protein psal_cds_1397 [Pandoravirus salinus]